MFFTNHLFHDTLHTFLLYCLTLSNVLCFMFLSPMLLYYVWYSFMSSPSNSEFYIFAQGFDEGGNFGSGSASFCEVGMVEKNLSILVNMKTQMGWNLELLKNFKYCVWNYDEFVHFLVHFKNIFLSLVWKRGGSGSGAGSGAPDPDPLDQIISDQGGSGSGSRSGTLIIVYVRTVYHL